EVEVDCTFGAAYAFAVVAYVFRVMRGDVSGDHVPEGGVLALEVVVAFVFWNLVRGTGVARLGWNPDTTVVSQRLAHERTLGLVLTMLRNAGGVDLRVAGVGEVRAFLCCSPDRGGVTAHRVGR